MVCTALLSADKMRQAFGGNFSYLLLGAFERLSGLRDKALCCASKDHGSGHGVASAALSHCAMLFCASVPLFHLPCPSSVQAAQGRGCSV